VTTDNETTAATERLAEIDRLAKADADDLAKMRDGTKLTRYGLVEIIAYQQQEIADLARELAEARAEIEQLQQANNRLVRVDFPELDCTDAAHPAWWRGHDHGAESICREAARILDGGEIHGSCAEPWETVRKRIAELKAQAAAFDDATLLTPEAVMELLPGNVEDYGGSMGGDYSSAVGKIGWGWYLSEDPDVGHEFWLQVSSRNVALCEFTVGRFRMLLTALAIAALGKSQ